MCEFVYVFQWAMLCIVLAFQRLCSTKLRAIPRIETSLNCTKTESISHIVFEMLKTSESTKHINWLRKSHDCLIKLSIQCCYELQCIALNELAFNTTARCFIAAVSVLVVAPKFSQHLDSMKGFTQTIRKHDSLVK